MACDMPEPCKFLSFDSCWKRFLWTHKEVDLVPHMGRPLNIQIQNRTSSIDHDCLQQSLSSCQRPFLFQQAVAKSAPGNKPDYLPLPGAEWVTVGEINQTCFLPKWRSKCDLTTVFIPGDDSFC